MADYYVDWLKSDGNGGTSWGDAWATISKAGVTVPDGSTVHIAFGLYYNESSWTYISPTNAGSLGIEYIFESPSGSPTTGIVEVGVYYPTLYAFEHSAWNRYVGRKYSGTQYCVGYQASTCALVTSDRLFYTDPEDVTKLVEVFIDEDIERYIYSGSALVLYNGFRFEIVDISNGSTYWVLTESGSEVDSGVTSSYPETYIYTATIAGLNNVPMIAINIKDYFEGAETEAAIIEGIWQIHKYYLDIS